MLVPARLSDKPHYVFHPNRLLRRALHGVGTDRPDLGPGTVALAGLPWGLELEVYSREAIGYTILTAGVFDPCVTETVYRLIEPGDLVVDVGANVGYLTSLAAARAGSGGQVVAYEPHPRVFERLQANVARWERLVRLGRLAPIELHRAAVSDRTGTGELTSGPLFHENMGLASLRADDAPAEDAELLAVRVHRLDDVLGARRVGLLKIDVEGHEPEVLRGAGRLLEAGLVRDVVFEDHAPYPDASTDLVERAGYRLFSLHNDLFGLRLGAPALRGPTRPWPGPSYLATRDPERAQRLLGARGWQVRGIGPALPWRGRRRSPERV